MGHHYPYLFRSLYSFLYLVHSLYYCSQLNYSRVITGVLGMSTAELLYGFIITEYQVNITIGNLAFFDILFTTITLLFFIDRIQYGLLKSYARLATYKQTVTWQNE